VLDVRREKFVAGYYCLIGEACERPPFTFKKPDAAAAAAVAEYIFVVWFLLVLW